MLISSKPFIMRNVCKVKEAISDVTRSAAKDGTAVPKHVATYTWSVRKVSDRIFLCEHLMDYNLARLHEPTLNLSAHA